MVFSVCAQFRYLAISCFNFARNKIYGQFPSNLGYFHFSRNYYKQGPNIIICFPTLKGQTNEYRRAVLVLFIRVCNFILLMVWFELGQLLFVLVSNFVFDFAIFFLKNIFDFFFRFGTKKWKILLCFQNLGCIWNFARLCPKIANRFVVIANILNKITLFSIHCVLGEKR